MKGRKGMPPAKRDVPDGKSSKVAKKPIPKSVMSAALVKKAVKPFAFSGIMGGSKAC